MPQDQTTRSPNHLLIPEDDAISQTLVAARSSAQALQEFPGKLPDSLDDAYAIQAASIERWPDDVAGWKVGMIPADLRARFAAERLAGPIFKSTIHSIASSANRVMPIYVGGFAAVEAEFVVELGANVPPTSSEISDQALIDLVSAWYVGAEIASSPMAAINILGPSCVVSDFGNNAGLVVGSKIPNWRTQALQSMTVRVTVDDEVVGDASAEAIPGGPMGAVRFLISLAAHHGIALPKGTLISTGASTGIHDVTTASKARVDFGDFGWFDLRFEPMPPAAGEK